MIFSAFEAIRDTNSATKGMSLTKLVETPAHQMLVPLAQWDYH